MLNITNENNMELMARYSDNHFDLAIVDPPYGIGAHNGVGGDNLGKAKVYSGNWDNETPNDDYFNELKRVSKNQIIWGGNYFKQLDIFNPELKRKNEFLEINGITWDKDNTGNYKDCEIAWNSWGDKNSFKYRWNGMLQQDMKNKENRIHPTQKPVALYKWILENYAQKGDKILDTHLGSGSIAIACHDYGFDLTACELDKDYYDSAMKRIKEHTDQLRII
jgi:site-specific DNA-methyltransferase (adenine-specific)